MSYILQALKKSEQEREQLNSSFRAIEEPNSAAVVSAGGNGALSVGDMGSSAFNWRSVLLISSILILLVVAGYINRNPEIESVERIKNDVRSIDQVLIKETRVSELATDKDISPNVYGNTAVEKIVTKKVEEQKQNADQPDPSAGELRILRPAISIEQASKDVQSLIPILEISSHIYSSLAVRRSIVVNGERFVEGDFISPEIQVKEITHQGMIIDVDDWPLVVSRSRGWSR